MKLKNKRLSIFLVPAGLFLFLAPYSLLVGWNLFSAALCWFLVIPTLALFLPRLVSKQKFQFADSLIGLILFYSLMIFLIYDHYQSDFFIVMIIGCAVNVLTVLLVSWIIKPSMANRAEA